VPPLLLGKILLELSFGCFPDIIVPNTIVVPVPSIVVVIRKYSDKSGMPQLLLGKADGLFDKHFLEFMVCIILIIINYIEAAD
jgi:hypothetical protein